MAYQPLYDNETNKVIRKTNNYNKFNFLPYNRPIQERHVKKLIVEITKKDHESIITVDKHYNIIDGQHRFCAYKALNLPFHYIQLDLFEVAETADYFVAINNNSQRLDSADYVNCLNAAYILADKKDSLPWQYAMCHKFVKYYNEVISNCEIEITYKNYINMLDRVVYLTNMKKEVMANEESCNKRFNEFQKIIPLCMPLFIALKTRKQFQSATYCAVIEFCRKKSAMDKNIMHNLLIAYQKYGAYDEFFRRMPVGIARCYDRLIDLYNFKKQKANRIQ